MSRLKNEEIEKLSPDDPKFRGILAEFFSKTEKEKYNLPTLRRIIVKKLESLQNLNLENIELGWSGSEFLNYILKFNEKITSANLHDCKMDARACGLLLEALTDSKFLSKIVLSCNFVGPDGGEIIAEFLKTNTSLTDLNLNSCDVEDAGIAKISEALNPKNNPNLVLSNLNIGYNSVTEKGCKIFCQNLKSNTTIISLNFYGNLIQKEGGFYFSEFLQNNQTLQTLLLNSCNLGAEGCSKLFEGLNKNSTLRTLYLAENEIKMLENDEKNQFLWEKFVECFKNNKTLTKLYLYENEIGPKGVQAIATVLSKNPKSLKVLNLSSCKIDQQGIIDLLQPFINGKNSSLTDLNLWGNNCTPDICPSVADVLKFNSTLTSLDLDQTSLDYGQGWKFFCDGMKYNTTILYRIAYFSLSQPILEKLHLLLAARNCSFHSQRQVIEQSYVGHEIGSFFPDILIDFRL